MLRVVTVAGAAVFMCSAASCRRDAPADLIIYNAHIHTVDLDHPRASAIAIRGDRIARVGDRDAVLRVRSASTRLLDAAGATIVPGLHDAHGHFARLGERLRLLDLQGTTSYEQVVERVRERVRTAEPGLWIVGRGWDQNDWPDSKWPSHAPLSAVSPDHPVYLTRVDGHAALANARAMALAGITRDTSEPDGGRILHDAAGRPIGVFIDNAKALITSQIPPPTPSEFDEQILVADRETRRIGLTMVHDAGVPPEAENTYRRLVDSGRVKTRLYVMYGGSLRELAPVFEATRRLGRDPLRHQINDRLVSGAVKMYADGALGSRGAALVEPYADEPSTSGLLTTSPEDLYALTLAAVGAGYQPAIHAIGDRANRIALDVYERVQREMPESRRLRMRIEHAQILDARDIPRFASLNVIASMQPTHATSDMPWVPARIGARRTEGAYVWRRLQNAGATIAAGSDFPVEDANPLRGFYAAITRQDPSGNPAGGWMPQERMTRAQALRAFTLDAAYAAHAEERLGSLEEGKLADLVMLSKDIMTVAPPEILTTEVRLTMIGGEIVFDATSAQRHPR